MTAQDRPMSSRAASTVSLRSLLHRFRRSRRGSAVVQFALVAPMFFALLFAIIEIAFMFFATQVLETITQNSARMILTGQAQTANYTQAQFATYVCGQVPALFSCPNIYIDVQSYNSFSAITINSQLDSSCNFVNNMQYNPGGPGDIVVVRLFYQWPMFVAGIGTITFNFGCGNTNQRLLVATAAFQNEPY
jgi:Flp pilus assembly protein TadG